MVVKNADDVSCFHNYKSRIIDYYSVECAIIITIILLSGCGFHAGSGHAIVVALHSI